MKPWSNLDYKSVQVGLNCMVVFSFYATTPGIQSVFVSASDDLVLVDSVLKTSEVHALLESTGLLVFFKGFGSQQQSATPGMSLLLAIPYLSKKQHILKLRADHTSSIRITYFLR